MSERTCSVDGCEKKHAARGWCNTHYNRMRREKAIEVRQFWSTTVCSVEGCEKKRTQLSWCGMHYMRMRRHGSLESVPRQCNTCSVDGCERPAQGRGWCNMHLLRMSRYGRLDARQYGTDDIGYSAAHYRVKSVRGSATNHMCTDCGNRAQDWSFNYSDPNPKYDDDTGMAYSPDVTYYEPRCKKCHKAFDVRCGAR